MKDIIIQDIFHYSILIKKILKLSTIQNLYSKDLGNKIRFQIFKSIKGVCQQVSMFYAIFNKSDLRLFTNCVLIRNYLSRFF